MGWKSDNVKVLTVSLTPAEVNMLDEFVKIKLAPSRSELMRFCIMFSWNELQKLARQQVQIINQRKVDMKHENTKNFIGKQLSETIFVKTGPHRYEKYVKANNRRLE